MHVGLRMPANALPVAIAGYGLGDVREGKANFPISRFLYDFKANKDTIAAGIRMSEAFGRQRGR
jgi:hypothetical protein